jgi:hypothetical protein
VSTLRVHPRVVLLLSIMAENSTFAIVFSDSSGAVGRGATVTARSRGGPVRDADGLLPGYENSSPDPESELFGGRRGKGPCRNKLFTRS